MRVSPETEDVLFREGEAPAEPRRDDSATILAIRSLAGADPRDPIEMRGPRPLRLRLGGSLALPFSPAIQGRGGQTVSAACLNVSRVLAASQNVFEAFHRPKAATLKCRWY